MCTALSPVRCAVYGGTFSPFTWVHRTFVEHLLGMFDRVIVVPSAQHAFKKNVIPYVDRFAMAMLALAPYIEGGRVIVSDVEQQLLKDVPPGGFIGAIDTLRALRRLYPECDLKFALGPDLRGEVKRWKNVETLELEFGFHFMPDLGVHATDVRNLRQAGDERWRQHVPAPVAAYIESRCLYVPL